MTDQISDKLCIGYRVLPLEGWRLYGVITGDITQNHGWGQPYPFRNQPSPVPFPPCTALWRGSIASYELAPDGRLWLTGYEYPFTNLPTQRISEALKGDFWLVLKEKFLGPRMYLPFRSSTIVADSDKWIYEKPPWMRLFARGGGRHSPWSPPLR